jgi:hypothetical protein
MKTCLTQLVTALCRLDHRDPARMTVVSATFEAPRDASLVELIDLATTAGLPRGDRRLSGVFEIRTTHGTWFARGGSKLLSRTGVKLADDVAFRKAVRR